MFSCHLLKHIEKEPESNIKASYVADILSKFCRTGIAKTSSLKQHAVQLKGIKSLLHFLSYMQAFEVEENQNKLERVQKSLSESVKIKPLGKKKIRLNMSSALNIIIMYLKKGREDKDAQKFHAGIEAAVEYLQERKEKLLAAINESANSQESEFKHAASSRFFPPDSSSSPPKKRPRITEEHEEKAQSEEENVSDVDAAQEQGTILEIQAH